jgi:rubrerythrin
MKFRFTMNKEMKQLQALKKYFKVAELANSKTNIIGGFGCDECGRTFNINLSGGCDTVVCPHCFNITSKFKK